MKQWFRKIAAILITIITLGTYIPPGFLTSHLDQDKGSLASKSNVGEASFQPASESIIEDDERSSDDLVEDERGTQAIFAQVMTEKAKEQTLTKFGDKIASQVEDEFMTTILPHMEIVLEMILAEAGEEESIYFGITEDPTPGYGEKIFNIYDYRTKKDIARFDVRRENRPLDGHWFNFHYHLGKDNFEKHYELGEIFWDKNMPPKWMA